MKFVCAALLGTLWMAMAGSRAVAQESTDSDRSGYARPELLVETELNAFGHSRLSLLNGGWQKWTAENRPITTVIPTISPTNFRVRETPEMTCALPQLLARKSDVVILDARSPDEYTGKTVSPGAAQAGRIPGAVNVEWKENVIGPNLEFKPAAALRAMYAAKGITPDK